MTFLTPNVIDPASEDFLLKRADMILDLRKLERNMRVKEGQWLFLFDQDRFVIDETIKHCTEGCVCAPTCFISGNQFSVRIVNHTD